MYEMPKCKCGEELEFDRETELLADGDSIIMTSHGHCPKCRKKYKWYDYYELSDWNGLEEETE